MTEREKLVSALCRGSLVRTQAAVARCAALGAEGERIVISCIPCVSQARRAELAWALRNCHGPEGEQALARLVSEIGPGSRDVRCSALVALTRRAGEGVTAIAREALAGSDATVREYAVLCLGRAGGEAAWPEVLAWWSARLLRKKPSLGAPDPSFAALVYLTRHCRGQNGALRTVELVTVIRSAWPRMNEPSRGLLLSLWPSAAPGGPPAGEVSVPDVTPPGYLDDWFA